MSTTTCSIHLYSCRGRKICSSTLLVRNCRQYTCCRPWLSSVMRLCVWKEAQCTQLLCRNAHSCHQALWPSDAAIQPSTRAQRQPSSTSSVHHETASAAPCSDDVSHVRCDCGALPFDAIFMQPMSAAAAAAAAPGDGSTGDSETNILGIRTTRNLGSGFLKCPNVDCATACS